LIVVARLRPYVGGLGFVGRAAGFALFVADGVVAPVGPPVVEPVPVDVVRDAPGEGVTGCILVEMKMYTSKSIRYDLHGHSPGVGVPHFPRGGAGPP
jgi:hypothetical protein